MKQELKYPDFLMETKKLRWKHVGAVPMNRAEMREFVQDIPPLAGFDKLLSKIGMQVDVRAKYERYSSPMTTS